MRFWGWSVVLPLEWADRLWPRRGHLLLERDEEPEKYEGIIWIPDSARGKRQPPWATVVAIGAVFDRDEEFHRYGFRVGQTVAINAAAGRPIYFYDSKTRATRVLLSVTPQQILAILDDAETENIEEIGEAMVPGGRFPYEAEAGRVAAGGRTSGEATK